MLKDTINKMTFRVRKRLVLSLISEKLAAIGFNIRAYYLTREFLLDEIHQNLKPELGPLVAEVLSSSAIIDIYNHPESKTLARDNKRLVEEGYMCFGLKFGNEVITYLWCNLIKCHEVHPFLLKEDEAYLARAFTFNTYRGKNMAEFLRYELYKYLKQIGRNRIYAFIDMVNTSSIKMQKKLKAEPLKIVINIKIFNKYNWNIMMRSSKKFLLAI